MPTVILAGGLATRLQPLTERIPKALIEVAGRPFLAHQLSWLHRQGVSRVVLLAGHLGQMIQEAFGDGNEHGLSIDYCFDGPILLGTGGAIRAAMPILPDRFFVLYGDSYLTCNMSAVQSAFERSGSAALMTVFHNDGRFDASNVEFDGGKILAYDKKNRTEAMRHIDYGLGVFRRDVFDSLPASVAVDLATVYQDLLKNRQLAAHEVNERFYEIGSVAGLRETDAFLRGSAGGGVTAPIVS